MSVSNVSINDIIDYEYKPLVIMGNMYRNTNSNQTRKDGIKGMVSIVVPVYNVKSYIGRCVDSLISQTYDNIEIILVDDGSTDGSEEICDTYADNDKRIRVVHKTNEGLGLTRNVGIDVARGEFLCFVDADDYIEKKTIEDSMSIMRRNCSEVVMYGMNRVYGDGKKDLLIPNPRKTLYKEDNIVKELLPDYVHDDPRSAIDRHFTSSSCTCLFRRDVFIKNRLKYESERNVISEDTYLMFDLLGHVKNVSIIKKCFYYYCNNIASLSHKYREDRFRKLKKYYVDCNALFDKNGYPEEVYFRFNYLFLDYVFADFKTIIRNEEMDNRAKYLMFREIIDDKLYRDVLNLIPKKYEPGKRRIFYFFVHRRMTVLCMLFVRIKMIGEK